MFKWPYLDSLDKVLIVPCIDLNMQSKHKNNIRQTFMCSKVTGGNNTPLVCVCACRPCKASTTMHSQHFRQ